MPKPLVDENCVENCLLTRALSGLCVGLVLTNAAGKVVWLNRTAERVLGVLGCECLGRPLRQLLKDLRLAAFWQESGEVCGNILGDVTTAWPEKLSLKVNATRYLNGDGEEVGRALLFCDVTAERTVQVTLTEDVATRLLNLTNGHLQPEPVAGLTQQEVRILRLVGSGAGNGQIARELSIAPSTVRSHLKHVYRKLGLRSRAEAVSHAVRNQVV